MHIPAVFAVPGGPDGGLVVMRPVDGTALPSDGIACGFREATSGIPRGDARGAVAIVDRDSICRGTFTEGVVKNMRVRGMDTWFMTCIADADDLMDAFNTTADMVMGPVHLAAGDGALADILSVSDSFIPVIMTGNGRRTDIWAELSRLERIGFYRMCVMDADGSVDAGTWLDIRDSYPSTVPFVPCGSCASDAGFGDLISPLTFRGRFRRSGPRPPGSLRFRACPFRTPPAAPATPCRSWPRTP